MMVRIPQIKRDLDFVGVDIKTTSVSVVQLQYNGKNDSVKLVTYGTAARDTSQSQNASQTIVELLRAAKVTTNDAILSLANAKTTMNIIELPHDVREEGIDAVIEKKAKELFGDRIREMAFGWSVIDRHIEKDEEQKVIAERSFWSILFVATPQYDIAALASIAKKANLNFIAPEARALALVRAVAHELDHADTILNADNEGEIEIIKTAFGTLQTITTFTSPEEVDRTIEEWRPSIKGSVIFSGAYGTRLFHEGSIYSLPKNRMALANPWKGMLVPRGLESVLRESGPAFAVACGLAMREIQREREKETRPR